VRTQERLALKVLHASLAADPKALEQFDLPYASRDPAYSLVRPASDALRHRARLMAFAGPFLSSS
jgi:hypothetical protein